MDKKDFLKDKDLFKKQVKEAIYMVEYNGYLSGYESVLEYLEITVSDLIQCELLDTFNKLLKRSGNWKVEIVELEKRLYKELN